MEIFELSTLTDAAVESLCRRNSVLDPQIYSTCEGIFQQVERRGDGALRDLTAEYERIELSDFRAPAGDFESARRTLSTEVLQALERAAANIRTFHCSQTVSEAAVEIESGISCWRTSRPIGSVGLYVPGGTAVLPSTALMLGIPAQVAGCSKVVLCTPARPDGKVDPAVLAAAELAGIEEVFSLGGAQAVAAMCLGTETVPRVAKILGPGNRYVQAAKLLATLRGTAIDMVAGPSEVLVVADQSAEARIVAADLISQAEHGDDSMAVLVTTSRPLAGAVQQELEDQLTDLPRRRFARRALRGSFILVVETLEEAFDFSNRFAPEHLIVQVENAESWQGDVQSAGSVFLGPWSPETAGDYASGTNHALPTSGWAHAVSGVSVDSFLKRITFQKLTRQGLESLAPTLETLSLLEQLEGHQRAVRIRLQNAVQERL